jgi:hypothetical protein
MALFLCSSFQIPVSQWLPVGAVFMKLCLVIEYNIFFIECHKAVYDRDASLPELYLGTTLFLASSLVNHSCDANMYKISYGTSIVFRAMRPIHKGEQLTRCYISPTPSFFYDFKERQEIFLDRWQFQCRYKC